MLPNKNHLPARLWVVLVSSIFLFLLTSCAEGNPFAVTAPAPCAVEGKPLYSGDVYPELQDKAAKEIVDKIRDFALQNINDNAKIAMAKREALKLLENQAKRWSDVQYISLENEPRIRAIVSFVSPGLIRAVVLNQWLYNINPASPANLDQITSESLKIFDDWKGFAFVLLIQSDSQSGKTFNIPPNSIILHNTTGIAVKSAQSDSFLNNSLSASERKHAGFFFYLSGLLDGQTCLPILNTNRETSLMLDIGTVTVGEKSNIPLTWRIYFPPLAQLNSSLFVPDFNNFTGGEEGNESPMSEPPTVSTFEPATDTINWRDVGRFIWWKLTMDHTP